jgi:hypothetical protein
MELNPVIMKVHCMYKNVRYSFVYHFNTKLEATQMSSNKEMVHL